MYLISKGQCYSDVCKLKYHQERAPYWLLMTNTDANAFAQGIMDFGSLVRMLD